MPGGVAGAQSDILTAPMPITTDRRKSGNGPGGQSVSGFLSKIAARASAVNV